MTTRAFRSTGARASGLGTMSPNSKNQHWSKWTFSIMRGSNPWPPFDVIDSNARRFAVKIFKSASTLRVRQGPVTDPTLGTISRDGYIIEILTEGEPVHDPAYRASVQKEWNEKFFRPGFGPGIHVHMHTKHMAGQTEDGSPSDQLIILPTTVEK